MGKEGNIMPAPNRIIELVERFTENFNYYQSIEYNEEDLRNEFLNPLFEELGWDIVNTAKKGADRDVHFGDPDRIAIEVSSLPR